jgi:hypothetical protein
MNKTGLQMMGKSSKCAEVASSNCRPVVARTSVVLSTSRYSTLAREKGIGHICDPIYMDNCLFI